MQRRPRADAACSCIYFFTYTLPAHASPLSFPFLPPTPSLQPPPPPSQISFSSRRDTDRGSLRLHWPETCEHGTHSDTQTHSEAHPGHPPPGGAHTGARGSVTNSQIQHPAQRPVKSSHFKFADLKPEDTIPARIKAFRAARPKYAVCVCERVCVCACVSVPDSHHPPTPMCFSLFFNGLLLAAWL
jgi:hypothetical protein